MAQVVYGGSQEFDALIYGYQHPGTLQYLENQFQNVGNHLTEYGKKFYEQARNLYEQFEGSAAIRATRAALQKVSSIFQRDEVRSLWELSEIQNAPLTMQRWIMAEPTVRRMYHDQRCDGYSDSYVDLYPKAIGDDHYDYRRVKQGIIEEPEEGPWHYTTYFDDLVEGDRELNLDEQIAILSTWEVVCSLMAKGEDDPTSVFGNKL